MDYLEKKLENQINESLKHLPYPNEDELLNKAYQNAPIIKNKKRIRFTIILASIMALVLLVGFTADIYFFPNNNSAYLDFESVQDQGYVNVYDEIISHDGINVTVKAIFSDGKKTYIRIKVTGNLPKEIEIKEGKDKGIYSTSEFEISEYIEDVRIADSSGKYFSWRNQIEYQSDELTVEQVNPILSSSQLETDEAILVFLDSPTKDATARIIFNIYGIDEPFIFKDLSIKMTEIVEREINDIEFSIDIGKGVIKKIIYTSVETRFIIDWTVNDYTLGDFYTKYETYYKNGKKEGFFQAPYPIACNDDGKVYRNEFILDEVLDPDEDLIIDLYEYVQPTGEYIYERNLVVIPKR